MLLDDFFEYIQKEAGCEYLSDLHTKKYFLSAINLIKDIDAEDYTLEEWQDMANYLTERNLHFNCAEDAKKFLIEYGQPEAKNIDQTNIGE